MYKLDYYVPVVAKAKTKKLAKESNLDISKLKAAQFTKEDIGPYNLVVALDI